MFNTTSENQHLDADIVDYRFAIERLAVKADVGFIDQISVAAAAADSNTATMISKYRRLRRARAVADIGAEIWFGLTIP
jgi:hypothetical protein